MFLPVFMLLAARIGISLEICEAYRRRLLCAGRRYDKMRTKVALKDVVATQRNLCGFICFLDDVKCFCCIATIIPAFLDQH